MIDLKELFEPITIGTLKLKNRIVMPPMGLRLADEFGGASPRQIDYYVERAKGGVGLIITGAFCTTARPGTGALTMHSKQSIFLQSELAESIQEWGAAAAAQLIDLGGTVNSAGELTPQTADQCSLDNIEQIIEEFAAAAVRSKAANFNAIEVHGAHGYIIAQFLSPLTNHRDDEYGGDVTRRAALPLAILKRIREEVGKDYPLLFRLSADEHLPGGVTLEQAKATAKLLEEAGINVLDVTAGKRPESFEWSIQPMSMRPGCLADLAQAMKETVKIPVIGVGRINDPILANQLIAERKADLAAMGRALIADPELPRKALEGRFDDIRKCVACLVCHQTCMLTRRPKCMVNAAIGKEKDFANIRKTNDPKRVLIAGGGPAGMEAARLLSLRGHQVILCEKAEEPGGQIPIAAMPPYKEDLREIVRYLYTQILKLGVEIRLHTQVSLEMASTLEPDAIIVAVGGQPTILAIPVANGSNILTAQDSLRNPAKVGNTVIVIGGGFVGCEIAELLTEQGKYVSIIEIAGDFAQNSQHPFLRKLLLSRISGIKKYSNATVEEVRQNYVVIKSYKGERFELPADTVIMALGCTPNKLLADQLQTNFTRVYLIGECNGEAGIPRAIADGARVGIWL